MVQTHEALGLKAFKGITCLIPCISTVVTVAIGIPWANVQKTPLWLKINTATTRVRSILYGKTLKVTGTQELTSR